MIYIKLDDKKENNIEKEKFFSKIIKKINKYYETNFMKLKEEKFENKTLIILPNLENKNLNKLSKYLKEKCVCNVCLSEELMNNKNFMEMIKKEDVKVFNGRWLFKHLVLNCLDYVTTCKKEKIEYQEISILSNEIDEVIVNVIKEIASKVRLVNIITGNECKFRKLEKELYEEKGIILNMNNNYKKSLLKSDIIFNFDFSEEEINKYTIPKKTCIINLKEEIKINTKSFEGINASFYEIPMPRKYLKNLIYLTGFNTSILYESFIYKNTNPINIKKEIENDDIYILFLNSKNGKIRKTEYLNLSKKLAN